MPTDEEGKNTLSSNRMTLEQQLALRKDGSLEQIEKNCTDISDNIEGNEPNASLRLMMLACEDHAPYGPSMNTAEMFLSLFRDVFQKAFNLRRNSSPKTCFLPDNDERKSDSMEGIRADRIDGNLIYLRISITIYEAKKEDYPVSQKEWDSYDGIIIPGSLSTAYEPEDWIETLKTVIQTEIHEKRRRTLGICFGHQLFAHSFGCDSDAVSLGQKAEKHTMKGQAIDKNGEEKHRRRGLAVKCPAGTQVGRKSFSPNMAGIDLLQPSHEDSVSLLYTHSDMVQSLPSCAVLLGGTDEVPVQAVAYFANGTEAETYLKLLKEKNFTQQVLELPTPYAFTFQAHPEFASELGLNCTFSNILKYMDDVRMLPSSILNDSKTDAYDQIDLIKKDSVNLALITGLALGWINCK